MALRSSGKEKDRGEKRSAEEDQRKAQEFVDAILTTTERTTPRGGPWCPTEDAEILKKIFAIRGLRMGGLVRQALRLLRMMEFLGPRGYESFFFGPSLTVLRPNVFEAVIDAALKRGTLRGIIERTDHGVRFLEPSMAGADDKAFSLTFRQMPRIAGFIDIISNMLMTGTIREICAEIFRPAPNAMAEMIAKDLEKALEDWIFERAQSLHYMRLARMVAGFLRASSKHKVDAIDDEAILQFWINHADVEGLRLFRGASSQVLVYRQALDAIETEATASFEAVDAELESDGTIDAFGERQPKADLTTVEWVSPLLVLFSDTAGRVKWLSKNDRNYIALYFHDVSEKKRKRHGATDPTDSSALSRQWRPDDSLILTFLRYVYFGGLQQGISKTRTQTVRHPINSEGYRVILDTCRAVLSEVEKAIASTAVILLKQGNIAGCRLVLALCREEATAVMAHAIRHKQQGAFRGLTNTAVVTRALLEGIATDAQLRRALRKIGTTSRQGLDPERDPDPETLETLEEGHDALLNLRAELAGLCRKLAQVSLAPACASDMAVFSSQFERLYGHAAQELRPV